VIVVAAVCPHPPLLVPELAAGAAGELDDLRRACDEAVGALATAEAVVAVGGDDHRAWTGFAPFGVEVPAGVDRPVPLSLLVGTWLLRRAGMSAEPVTVDVDAEPQACVRLGERLAADPRRLGLLVLGDGSICRGVRAPGYDDPRAPGYDARVSRALADVDTDSLLALDPELSAELGVAGRAAWQVAAAAVWASGGGWAGRVLYDAAPYGVAYLVATWVAEGAAG